MQYHYVGSDPGLIGMTALGLWFGTIFKVQVDAHEHPWAYGWYETPASDWEIIDVV